MSVMAVWEPFPDGQLDFLVMECSANGNSHLSAQQNQPITTLGQFPVGEHLLLMQELSAQSGYNRG
jgi:hypothetical protein